MACAQKRAKFGLEPGTPIVCVDELSESLVARLGEAFSKLASSSRNRQGGPKAGITRYSRFHGDLPQAQAMKARCEVSRQDAGCEQFEVFTP